MRRLYFQKTRYLARRRRLSSREFVLCKAKMKRQSSFGSRLLNWAAFTMSMGGSDHFRGALGFNDSLN
jgi:hypothetical protein